MKPIYSAIGILLAFYVVAPLIILLTHKQNAYPQAEPVDPSAADSFVRAGAEMLQAAGFELIGFFRLTGLATNVVCTLAYLAHRRNGDLAMACAAVSPAKTVTFCEFATRFQDQSAVTTGNSSTGGAYKRPANKPVFHFPAIQDVRRLYAIHLGAIRKLRSGIARDVPAQGHEVERLIDGLQREMSDQVPVGILRLDQEQRVYRPTFYGAFRMTWLQLPPFKQIAQLRRKLRCHRLLKELEADPNFAAGL